MKARNILNSNLLKIQLCKFFLKEKRISKFFASIISAKKKFERKLFKKKFIQPPKLYCLMILNTKNKNYMDV